MDNKNKETFSYTYSAKEQEEIKTIRKKYVEEEQTEDKMSLLRRLDAAVTQKATTIALVFGVIGVLIMGIGMSLAMTEIGEMIGLLGSMSMLVGILIGIVGIILVCMAYPVYNRIIRKERKKIAPKIIKLTDELMK
jgi:predicted glycosyltransferase